MCWSFPLLAATSKLRNLGTQHAKFNQATALRPKFRPA